MPRYSSGKGNKRGASQPPAKEPPAKVHALSAIISSMDKALMFGEDDVGMNVTGLVENASPLLLSLVRFSLFGFVFLQEAL